MNSKSEGGRQSWLCWVVFGATPDQRKVFKKATYKRKTLQKLVRRLNRERKGADKVLIKSINNYRKQYIANTLINMPLEKLGKAITPSRLKALGNGGYCNVSDLLNKTSAQLQQLRGIGPVSASDILKSVHETRAQLLEAPFEIPPPDKIDESHEGILRAIYKRVRTRHISHGYLSDLQTAAENLSRSIKEAKRECRIWKRIFQRSKTEQAVENSAQVLHALSESPRTEDITEKGQALLKSLTPPDGFKDLIADYREHYADYFSAIDKVLSSKNGKAAVPQGNAPKGRYGRIPKEIADGVEALNLSTDGLDVDLRGYQEFGAKYLAHQKRSVLGDEMGLGKTIQAMAVMIHLKNTEKAKRFLVVCPASIIGNWVREIEMRTKLPIRLLHGAQRHAQSLKWQARGGVAVTSYATLSSLQGLEQTNIHFLVVDEAHYIKNPEANRSRQVERLAKNSNRIVLMTGTALENRPQEFVNLVRVCDAFLGSRLGAEATKSRRSVVAKRRFDTMVSPVYMRRNQEDVLRELPECIEIEEWVELTAAEHKKYLIALQSENLMFMRQAANGDTIQSSKLLRLKEIFNHYRSEGTKVVIFSYFLRALDLIGQVVGSHSRIDGNVSATSRMELIDKFNNGKETPALLCQITAGGVGINLQSASAVILFEPQFKPTTEWQAIKRVHRMGQSRRVTVHRFFARNTVDESLRKLVGAKTKIFNDYARESAVKNASPSAVDVSDAAITKKLVEMEIERHGHAMAS